MSITTAAQTEALKGLNVTFDTIEAQALINAFEALSTNPTLATVSTYGTVKKMNDPGTIPSNSTLAFVIAVINDYRDKLIAAGLLEEGAGGGS
jgi:hypothetical protein